MKEETTERLLEKYKEVWEKIDRISEDTNNIIKTSGFRRAPPIFFKLTDKQYKILKYEAEPIWEKLKNKIRSREHFTSFKQSIQWREETTPPSYKELGIKEVSP